MGESESHKRAKKKAAGEEGKTEVHLPQKKRLDAITKDAKRATEIERSGDPALLEKAAGRLKSSGAPQKTLKVPQGDMDAAIAAMKAVGVPGTVENLGGTKSQKVRNPQKRTG